MCGRRPRSSVSFSSDDCARGFCKQDSGVDKCESITPLARTPAGAISARRPWAEALGGRGGGAVLAAHSGLRSECLMRTGFSAEISVFELKSLL